MRYPWAWLVACALALGGPRAWAGSAAAGVAGECVLEATFAGVVPAGELDGIEFVHPVLEQVVDRGCAGIEDVVPILPDPGGSRWIAGSPRLEIARRYRLRLTPATALGTHVVHDAQPAAADANVESVASERIPTGDYAFDKSGNGQPPCSRLSWRPDAMPVPLEVHQAVTDDVSDGSDLAAIETAIDVWATAPCSNARLRLAGTYDRSTPLLPDGINTIEWIEEPAVVFDNLGPENLGFTCYVCDDEGYFVEADVRFDGARHAWSTDCSGDAFDVLGAVLHELGHVLGAPHVDQSDAVMFPVTSPRRLLSTRVLSRADMLDVCERYPCEGGECGLPVDDPGSCTAGAGICAPCAEDGQCGASPDVCTTSTTSGDSTCARACSPSFPCPGGFDCVAVGASAKQCIPAAGRCPDQARLGCPCVADSECAGEGDRCVDGACATPCDGGIECPEQSACVLLYDDDGLPTSRYCLTAGDFEPRCGRSRDRGCDCAAGGAPSGDLAFVVLALGWFVVRGRSAR